MTTNAKLLGIMKPLGGGDPIPLKKSELIVGRRPSCDIQLDFENVSGRHCRLHHHNGVWYVRDLGSTNGTKINGQKISTEHGVMPDDELGIAGHYYMIEYDPAAPASVLDANLLYEQEIAEAPTRHQRSLMELAGLAGDSSESTDLAGQRPTTTSPRPEPLSPEPPLEEPAEIELEDEAGDPPPPLATTDDEFFEMIREDVEK